MGCEDFVTSQLQHTTILVLLECLHECSNLLWPKMRLPAVFTVSAHSLRGGGGLCRFSNGRSVAPLCAESTDSCEQNRPERLLIRIQHALSQISLHHFLPCLLAVVHIGRECFEQRSELLARHHHNVCVSCIHSRRTLTDVLLVRLFLSSIPSRANVTLQKLESKAKPTSAGFSNFHVVYSWWLWCVKWQLLN